MNSPRAIFFLLSIGLVFPPFARAAACASGESAPTGTHMEQRDFLGALSHSRARQMMLQGNRELQLARRAVDAARADIVRAGQAPNPILTLQTFNINPSQGFGPNGVRSKAVDSTIRIDQLIERGDKREIRTAQAQFLESASGEDLVDMARQSGLAVSAAYYDLLLAQERVDIARELAGLFAQTLDAAERRVKAGDIAPVEVSRIRVDALRSQNDARNAEADRVRAQGALGYLLGVDARSAQLCATDAWPRPEPVPGKESNLVFGDEQIDRRPDVRSARARAEAASKARDLARSLRTRDVSVGIQFEHWPQNGDNLQGSGNSYGIAVSIPLFVRNQSEGEVQRAEADFTTAVDGLARVRAQAQADLMRASADLEAAAERLGRYDRSMLVEATKSAESAEFAYRNGAMGVMDLLDARRTLRSIRIEAAQARNDFAKALAAWDAAGGNVPSNQELRGAGSAVRVPVAAEATTELRAVSQ